MKRKIILTAMLLLIAGGCYCSYRYYHDDVLPEKVINKAHDEQIQLFERIRPEMSVHSDKTSEIMKNPLQSAEEINSNVVGWITINGTHIDFPVAQAEDNDFYLHNGFDGKYNNELGCPFLDYRCVCDFSGFNSIIYGHHMTDQRMFADIALFKDRSFLQSHQTGTLITKNGERHIQFFAYMNVTETASAYHAVFVSDAEKNEYIDYIFSDAQYTSGYNSEELKEKDDLHLILLSTCTYEFENARGILIGVLEPD